jgi:DNA-3-methyladenine glycosylase
MKERSGIEDIRKNKRAGRSFYARDVLEVAPEIMGKTLVVNNGVDTGPVRLMISEVEAYRGEEDRACHASKGRTPRTEVMYHQGGKVYVYFVYGMYWMLNIVTGLENDPQALLVRGVEGICGPGRITKKLLIDGTFYGEDLTVSDRIWIEESRVKPVFKTGPRIGINYAGEPWISKPWRYFI